MDEDERKEKIKDIVDDIQRDVKLPPYDTDSGSQYSRTYKEFKEEEIESRKKTKYERLCNFFGSIFTIKAGEETHEKLTPPILLLGWNITPGMVLSATVGVFLVSMFLWAFLFALNSLAGGIIPMSLMLLTVSVPLTATAYTYKKPVFAAQDKVIHSSGEMILAVLYMVVYMRKSPNLEGAIRFAALNLEGPIASDLKNILWNLEVGEYNRVEEALEDYTRRWKDYNDDFLESLNLLRAAMNQTNAERRQKMMDDSIDTILEGTQEKMKHYAQSLQTPVMIINAMGAMLPVLGMILLPMISAFLGGLITPMHLIILFNLMLPGFLYWFIQRALSSRPPTVNTEAVDEETMPERGKYPVELMGREFQIPTWSIGLGIFLLIGSYGMWGYLQLPAFYPIENFNPAGVPGLFIENGSPAPFPMLMRSVSLVLGAGLGIGVTKVLGTVKRKEAEDHLGKIESQFPSALFELGNEISGGTPIEIALQDAAESTDDLEISELFYAASENIRDMGMTFNQAIFDEQYGALRQFPSQMIKTVMKVAAESSRKGTKVTSTAMTTISEYLKTVHQTQEKLNDLMEDTTTTIKMLAYMLGPVISGVAVGMSQTIISALFKLSESFQQTKQSLPQSQASNFTGIGILKGLDQAIPPELLQFVVGIYLIELLHLLGIFYMKITEGDNPTFKNLFTGKILISGMIFYTMTLMIISLLFGGIMSNIGGAV
ncbi:MAG: hypothetical protein ABEJ95_03915 [Candidatus Nanohalobium sp.]